MLKTDLQPIVDLYIDGHRIPTHEYLTKLEVKRSIGVGGYEGNLELFDPTWTFLESFILEKGVNTSIDFSYGWGSDSSIQVEAKLMNYKPQFSEDGVHIYIEFALGSRVENRVKHNICWPGSMTISDIVTNIAKNNGWQYEIEPTKGIFDRSFVQDSVSDAYFIKNILSPRAINHSNVGGYKFYLENNKLFFSTKSYKRDNIYKSYVFQRGDMHEVISFSPSDNVADMAQFGGTKVKVTGYDPKEKKILSSEVSTSNNSGSVPIEGNKVTKVIKDINGDVRVISKPFHRKEDVDSYANSQYCEFAQWRYNVDAEIIGDPRIPLMSNLEFILITSMGSVHYMSGVYQLFEATDKIENGSFKSQLSLMRSSISRGSETVKGIIKKLVKTEPINISKIRKVSK
jgi:hypothetical protein